MSKKRIFTDVELVGIHSKGRAFGYIGNRKIYADGGMAGEVVDIERSKIQSGDFLQGTVCNVKKAAPTRVTPFCKHFGICGGCEWQHVDYREQLEQKRRILQDAFAKYSIVSPEIPLPLASPATTFFRHRIEYQFSTRRWYYEGEGKVTDPSARLALGFHPSGNTGKTVDIEECYLQRDPSQQIIAAVKEFTRAHGFTYFDPKEKTGFLKSIALRMTVSGEILCVLTFAEADEEKQALLLGFLQARFPQIHSLYFAIVPGFEPSFYESEIQHWEGTQRYITEMANGLKFRISPQSFYQPNPAQAELIFKTVWEKVDLQENETLVDLYCGIGALTLSANKNRGRFIGIENSPSAIADADCNAAQNGFANTEFICGDVLETFTPKFLSDRGSPDVVILDPPRSGTLIEIKKTILAASPRKIIYLSCNPVSLAFDLKMLLENYRITYIQPFDQFPHTHHLETLVVLERE